LCVSVEQEILALIELYIAAGTLVTRGLQQQDVVVNTTTHTRALASTHTPSTSHTHTHVT